MIDIFFSRRNDKYLIDFVVNINVNVMIIEKDSVWKIVPQSSSDPL